MLAKHKEEFKELKKGTENWASDTDEFIKKTKERLEASNMEQGSIYKK